jgi:hypothetical protein
VLDEQLALLLKKKGQTLPEHTARSNQTLDINVHVHVVGCILVVFAKTSVPTPGTRDTR